MPKAKLTAQHFSSAIQPKREKSWDVTVGVLGVAIMLLGLYWFNSVWIGIVATVVVCVALELLKLWWDGRKRQKPNTAPETPPSPVNSPDKILADWRKLLAATKMKWVVFEHGSCVLLEKSEKDPRAAALEMMRRFGPVEVGTSSGDMTIEPDEDNDFCLIRCHHPQILNYLDATEITIALATSHPEALAGHIGRNKRDWDSRSLKVIHVEDLEVG